MDYYASYKKSPATPKNNDASIPNRIKQLLSNPIVAPSTASFLGSLKKYFDKFGGLTEKQVRALKKIEEKYEQQLRLVEQNWQNEYDAAKKEKALICAEYYLSNPPYFSELANRIVVDRKFVPTKQQFDKLTNNKYSMKILATYYEPAKYKKGQLIYLRATAPFAYHVAVGNKPCLILEENIRPIRSAAKGAKRYKILPIGETKYQIVEERYLKKTKSNYS